MMSSAQPIEAGPSLALTDDEVIALGCRSRSPWPSATPTAPSPTSGKEVARGMRSLMVRRLLDADGADHLDPALEHLAAAVVGADRSVAVYWATSDLTWATNQRVVVFHHDADGGWIRETISPIGIHVLDVLAARSPEQALESLIDEHHRAGLSEDAAGAGVAHLCLASHGSSGSRAVIVSEGSITLGVFDDGGLITTAAETSVGAGEAVRHLLGQLDDVIVHGAEVTA